MKCKNCGEKGKLTFQKGIIKYCEGQEDEEFIVRCDSCKNLVYGSIRRVFPTPVFKERGV